VVASTSLHSANEPGGWQRITTHDAELVAMPQHERFELRRRLGAMRAGAPDLGASDLEELCVGLRETRGGRRRVRRGEDVCKKVEEAA
jgi:hypothetical protein